MLSHFGADVLDLVQPLGRLAEVRARLAGHLEHLPLVQAGGRRRHRVVLAAQPPEELEPIACNNIAEDIGTLSVKSVFAAHM